MAQNPDNLSAYVMEFIDLSLVLISLARVRISSAFHVLCSAQSTMFDLFYQNEFFWRKRKKKRELKTNYLILTNTSPKTKIYLV